MAMVIATHEPFLHSRAQVLVLPLSADGDIRHPILARTKTMFADNYENYCKKVAASELVLGSAWIHKIQKQQTGLGVATGKVDYIANLCLQKFLTHPVSLRVLMMALKTLKPELYQLMRYQGVRRVSFLATPLLSNEQTPPSIEVLDIGAADILRAWQEVFADMSKLTIQVHFSKITSLPENWQIPLEKLDKKI